MGIITPTNQSVTELKGLHLYHSAISNCSMRPRMVLEEKNLPWVSHHLELTKAETHTPEYFGINPNGVVPTLVHDGVVIIESDDITEYLDERFPDPPLRSKDPAVNAEIHAWLKLATGIHVRGVKTTIYHNKMRGKLQMSDEAMKQYRKLQTNQDLLAFHQKSASAEGFSAEEVTQARKILDESFQKVEDALSAHRWIVGNDFSLADIAWVPLHFTLIGANYSFDKFPRVSAWADAIRERPSFQKGVLKWCPKF
ncbi:MAG TPA: glutathione S-transferase family protein [Candidatus Binataceae bacterium]|nr:glutathione S-transferase family protein [Candidatus Binataceae bacterium]HTY56110.1 glutathione S-transferase family protein [Candidatus Binataceae bacterium]